MLLSIPNRAVRGFALLACRVSCAVPTAIRKAETRPVTFRVSFIQSWRIDILPRFLTCAGRIHHIMFEPWCAGIFFTLMPR